MPSELGFDAVLRYLPFIARGLLVTVEICAASLILSMALGVVVGIMRLSRVRLASGIATLYVDFFRATPLVIQLVWIYYALPILLNRSLGVLEAGILGLTLYEAAYIAEVVRAGILSLPEGQREAGFALGMSGVQVMRRVVLPQALVTMIPALTNQLITLVKDSAITSVIGLPELMQRGQSIASYTTQPFAALTTAAFVYFAITFPLSLVTRRLHRRLATPSG